MGKWDKERKEWKEMLYNAHNVIPLEEVRGRKVDLKLLDLYIRHKLNTTIKWHHRNMVILTFLIVVLTVFNIYLSFSK